MELMIAAGKAVPKLQLEFGLAVDRVYTGSFMSSLDMAGWLLFLLLYRCRVIGVVVLLLLNSFPSQVSLCRS